jgi:hypothetical protein
VTPPLSVDVVSVSFGPKLLSARRARGLEGEKRAILKGKLSGVGFREGGDTQRRHGTPQTNQAHCNVLRRYYFRVGKNVTTSAVTRSDIHTGEQHGKRVNRETSFETKIYFPC